MQKDGTTKRIIGKYLKHTEHYLEDEDAENKKVIRWKLIIPLEIIVGILLLLAALVLATNVDMRRSERELLTTADFYEESV